VQGAFADAIKAREDQERLINIAQAYANEVVPIARGDASRAIEEANAYKSKVIAEAEGEAARFLKVLGEYQKAPRVTRERMYLDALESVLSRSSKVVVDTKGGNNMIYLPMDKLMQREAQSVKPATGASTAAPAAEPLPARTETRTRDDVRRREVR
jgi:membrane protease subunit HflK